MVNNSNGQMVYDNGGWYILVFSWVFFALIFSSGKTSHKSISTVSLTLMGARRGRRNGQIGLVVRGIRFGPRARDP